MSHCAPSTRKCHDPLVFFSFTIAWAAQYTWSNRLALWHGPTGLSSHHFIGNFPFVTQSNCLLIAEVAPSPFPVFFFLQQILSLSLCQSSQCHFKCIATFLYFHPLRLHMLSLSWYLVVFTMSSASTFCSLLAEPNLVPKPSEPVTENLNASTSLGENATTAQVKCVPPKLKDAESTYLELSIHPSLKDRGFSVETPRRIVATQTSSTLQIYAGKWKAFENIYGSIDLDPFQASIPQKVDFLLYLFHERKLSFNSFEG